MVKKQLRILITIFAIFTANSIFTTYSVADEYKIGNLKIIHPYIMETPKGAMVAGGYMKIVNTGNQTDHLSLVTVDFSKVAEIHEMKTENDIIKMRKIKGELEIPAKDFTKLKHEGYHIMFMNLLKPMIRGEVHEGTLYFEKAGKVKVIFTIEKMGFKFEENN